MSDSAMTAQEKVQQAFAERIRPHLEELGIEAFAICAYVKDGEGNVSKVAFGGSVPGNPAYADGLRTISALSAKWTVGEL